MEYLIITDVERFQYDKDYFFKPKKTADGQSNKFRGESVPVGNEKLFQIGNLWAMRPKGDKYHILTKELTFSNVGDAERKSILEEHVTLSFSVTSRSANDQTYDFYSTVPTRNLSLAAAAPVTPDELKTVLGNVTIEGNVGVWRTAAVSIGAAAGAGTRSVTGSVAGAAGSATGSAAVLGALSPMNAATIDLFLWCLNGDFGTNSLRSILERNPNLNRQIVGRIEPVFFDRSTKIASDRCNIIFDTLEPYLREELRNTDYVYELQFLPPEMREGKYTITTMISPLALLCICYYRRYTYTGGFLPFITAMSAMIEKGANPSLALNTACWQRLPDAVSLLLKKGASANEPQRFSSHGMDVVTIPLLTSVPFVLPSRIPGLRGYDLEVYQVRKAQQKLESLLTSMDYPFTLISLSSADESDNREMLVTDSIIIQLEARKAEEGNPNNSTIDIIIQFAIKKRKEQQERMFAPGGAFYRALQRKIHPGMTNANLNVLNRLADRVVYGNNVLGGGSYKYKRRSSTTRAVGRRGTIKKQKTITE